MGRCLFTFPSGGCRARRICAVSFTRSILARIHGREPHDQAVRVLCIDGGGIRGIIPAVVLAELERRTGRHPVELFDLFAGTSTGSILAMGMAAPGPDGRPRHRAEVTPDAYTEFAPHIFPRTRLPELRGLVQGKYSAAGLEET